MSLRGERFGRYAEQLLRHGPHRAATASLWAAGENCTSLGRYPRISPGLTARLLHRIMEPSSPTSIPLPLDLILLVQLTATLPAT